MGFRETKLKREGEMSFGGVRGDKSGLGRRGNLREGVAVLMNERIWMCIKEIRWINFRIMHVELCIKRRFWNVIIVYVSGMERSEEEIDCFWEELKWCIELWEAREKVVAIGDMNARVGY